MRRRAVLGAGALVLLALVATAIARRGSGSSQLRSRTTTAEVRSGRSGPLLAVVGASFSTGVGAGNRHHAWPEDLGRLLGWRVAVEADPGAGYVDPGGGGRGAFSRLTPARELAPPHPRAILPQGAHDDIGRPLPLIRDRVKSLF